MQKYRRGRTDTTTGRNKRDKSPITERAGIRPERWNGRIVRGGRLAAARAKATQGKGEGIEL